MCCTRVSGAAVALGCCAVMADTLSAVPCCALRGAVSTLSVTFTFCACRCEKDQ